MDIQEKRKDTMRNAKSENSIFFKEKEDICADSKNLL